MAKVFTAKVTDNLEDHLRDALSFLEWERIVPSDARVFFKPNLTYPVYKKGVTTSPEFISAVLRVFADRTSNMIVGESDGGYRSWSAEMSFRSHRLPEICRHYGARLVNLSKEPNIAVPFRLSKGEVFVPIPALLVQDIDLFVTLPVPKIHQVTTMSGAIKNQWGCIPDKMRLVNHPFFDEMILEINRVVKARVALVDGMYFLNRSGPMFGEPVQRDLILASDNIGALDMSMCQIMGIPLSTVRYLCLAGQLGWIPTADQIEYNAKPESFHSQQFFLELTLRNRVVRWAFDRPWAISLLWNSRFGDLLHKLMYAIVGNPVHDDMVRLSLELSDSRGENKDIVQLPDKDHKQILHDHSIQNRSNKNSSTTLPSRRYDSMK